MASETEANKARKLHGPELRKKGVHAIGVEEGRDFGHKGWVVVAHVAPGPSVDLPATLPLATAAKSIDVPLVVRKSTQFTLD